MNDFERASGQYEEISYVLVAYVLDCDGYHWNVIYAKADQIKNDGGGSLRLSVSAALHEQGGGAMSPFSMCTKEDDFVFFEKMA